MSGWGLEVRILGQSPSDHRLLVLVLDKNPIRSRVIDHRFLAGCCWLLGHILLRLHSHCTVTASGHIVAMQLSIVLARKSCWNLHFLNPGHILGGRLGRWRYLL